jgi:hypothetical protein
MTIAVIDLPPGDEVDRLLAAHDGAIVAVLESRARAYLLVRVDGRAPDSVFLDPTDGELLLGSHSFNDEAEARAWVAADFLRRAAPSPGAQ